MRLAPFAEGHQRLIERGAEIGQSIVDAGRNLLEVVPYHHLIALEIFQMLNQHLLADRADLPLELAEAPRRRAQLVQDQGLPFAADDGQRRLEAAAIFVLVTS